MTPHTTAADLPPQRRRDAETGAEENEKRVLSLSLLPQLALLPQSRRSTSPSQTMPALQTSFHSASSSASLRLCGKATATAVLALLLSSCHKTEEAEVEAPAPV